MTPAQLRSARKQARLTQLEAARKLGVTQAYLSMLETGKRALRDSLARRLATIYGVPPPRAKRSRFEWSEDEVARQLGNLGYPGFAHLRGGRRRNPTELLAWCLQQETLDARLVRALPWLALHSPATLDWNWIVEKAKLSNRQNRLGFVLWLARDRAAHRNASEAVGHLRTVEDLVSKSKLVSEDPFFRTIRSRRMREWVEENRLPSARHWRVLTTFRPEEVRYA